MLICGYRVKGVSVAHGAVPCRQHWHQVPAIRGDSKNDDDDDDAAYTRGPVAAGSHAHDVKYPKQVATKKS
jgi:hypothetical protein